MRRTFSAIAVVIPALCCWSLAVAQQPANRLQQAAQLMAQSRFAAAEKMLAEIVAETPGNFRAWNMLGSSQHAQQKFEEAVRCFEKASGGPAFQPSALFNRGCSLARLGKLEDSVASLDRAFAAGFNNVDLLAHDPDLAQLRDHPPFQRLLQQQRKSEKLFVEPDARIIHRWLGEAGGDEFGWVARVVGDCDRDGVLDFVATSPSHNKGAGKIYVYSGKSGKLLFDIPGRPGERLGNGASAAGDVNNDGVPDILIGAPHFNNRTGAAYVFSGRDGRRLLELVGKHPGGRFGYKVAPLFDLDGDRHDDVFVGAIDSNTARPKTGAGFGYSGRTGDLLFSLAGNRTGDNFGSSAAATRAGLETWLAVGAQNAGQGQRGEVNVYRIGAGKPKLVFQIKSQPNNTNLGMMFLSFPGDSNGDGVPDVYASDWQASAPNLPGAGQVVLHSGSDGSRILELYGQQRGEGLGTSPSNAGDVNGDGVGDLIIGAWQHRGGAPSGGRVTLHDGKTGQQIDSWTCVQAGDTFGFDAVGIGDVDGDGNTDFLLTSAWANIRGPRTGRVFIVAGKNYDR